MIARTIICALLCLALSGCWDGVELENRGIVNAIGIDRDPDSGDVLASVALPDLAEIASKNGAKQEGVLTGAGKTALSAIRAADQKTNQKLFLGQTKAVVFGKEALKDEGIVRSALDALQRNGEISRKTLIFAADAAAKDILEAKLDGSPLIGTYFATYYKNTGASQSSSIRLDLQGAVDQFETDGACLMPKIVVSGKLLDPQGGCLLSDYKYACDLDEEQTDGVLLLQNRADGLSDSVVIDGSRASLHIKSCRKQSSFCLDAQGCPVYNLELDIQGDIQEYMINQQLDEDSQRRFEAAFERDIASRIDSAAAAFSQANADGFGLRREMYKFANGLYRREAANADLIRELTVQPSVKVEIVSIGVLD